MNKENNLHITRTLSPKERVEFDNLRADVTELKQIVKDQSEALIELSKLLEGSEVSGTNIL